MTDIEYTIQRTEALEQISRELGGLVGDFEFGFSANDDVQVGFDIIKSKGEQLIKHLRPEDIPTSSESLVDFVYRKGVEAGIITGPEKMKNLVARGISVGYPYFKRFDSELKLRDNGATVDGTRQGDVHSRQGVVLEPGKEDNTKSLTVDATTSEVQEFVHEVLPADTRNDFFARESARFREEFLVGLSHPAREVVEKVIAVDKSPSNSPLVVATRLGAFAEACAEFAKEHIRRVIDTDVPKDKRTPVLSRMMLSLAGLLHATKDFADWCMQWVKPESGLKGDELSDDLESAADGAATDDVDALEAQAKRAHEARLYEKMKARVFGSKEPSKRGFQSYLNRLHQSTESSSYEEKKEICRVVNFWTSKLSVHLVFGDEECSLGPKTSGSEKGGFQLKSRKTGSSLYSLSKFPPLNLRNG